jgi:hypothetical protein
LLPAPDLEGQPGALAEDPQQHVVQKVDPLPYLVDLHTHLARSVS